MRDNEPTGLTIVDVGSVEQRIAELGLTAAAKLCILPRYFFSAKERSELVYEQSTPDLKVLFRQAKLPMDKLEPDGVKIPYVAEHDNTLVLPAVFLGLALWSQNPELVNVALGVTANYVTDWFRGKLGRNRVKFSVVVEKTEKGTTKQINYDGPPEQFKDLVEAVKKSLK
ncbi:hypothetical protein [Frigoriglobus tundricola]|uniref:Uncharacterized protein n=1 Tax=Frigoriglobus tundricola TaxID=2774151 RepID=A0A6M5Z3S2_9BACT|nr:hypothetical protein [Frigoriglobus tundricola]QJX01070.1 hypothetical protein FTUN_8709 [Frigoriglobus tundricola]